MRKFDLLSFVFVVFFTAVAVLFPAQSTAYDYLDIDPSTLTWIIHDDELAEEDAARVKAQRNARRAEIGILSQAPAHEFGIINPNRGNEWLPSIYKGARRLMNADYVETWFRTPAFDFTGGRYTREMSTTGGIVGYMVSNAEIEAWFEDLQNLPDSRMQFRTISGFPYFVGDGGYHEDGTPNYKLYRTFSLLVSVFSIPSVFTPEEVRALGKPVVWLHGSIHGGEVSSTEGLLQLAKEFASGKHDDILEKVTVVIVPRFNVDGAFNVQRTTTSLAPVGHAGQSVVGVDMNRDFIAFETPLVRAMRQLIIAYDPVVTICGHEFGYTFDQEFMDGRDTPTGFRRGYQTALTTTMTLNLNVDRRVRNLGQHIIEPAIKRLLRERGLGWCWFPGSTAAAAVPTGTTPWPATQLRDGEFGQVISADGVTGPVPGHVQFATFASDFALVPEEGIGINGIALGNQSIVLVTEAASVGGRLDFLRRSYAHYLANLAAAQSAADNIDTIMRAVNAARATEIARTEPLSFWGTWPRVRRDVRNVLEYADWRKENTPDVVNAVRFGTRPIMSVRARESQRDPIAQVTRPVAYIIPAEHYEAAIRLFYTGAQLERLVADTTLEVEVYTVLATGAANVSPHGATAQAFAAIREVSKTTRYVTFPRDSFVVRMDQLGASLVGLALEPMAIRNYGNFFLSRTRGLPANPAATDAQRTNSMRIPEWYRYTFLPVAVGQEFPAFRLMNPVLPETYPANMNVPFMLTSVAKVHSPTQDDVEKIRASLRLENAPEFISYLELPVLPGHSVNEAFLLPDGTRVDFGDFTSDSTRRVLIVAPEGLTGNIYFAAGDDRINFNDIEFALIHESDNNNHRSGGCAVAGYPPLVILALITLFLWHRRRGLFAK